MELSIEIPGVPTRLTVPTLIVRETEYSKRTPCLIGTNYLNNLAIVMEGRGASPENGPVLSVPPRVISAALEAVRRDCLGYAHVEETIRVRANTHIIVKAKLVSEGGLCLRWG